MQGAINRAFVGSLFALGLSGCAERSIDILDNNGKVVGGCIAGFDWHLYGLQDSIDYMLYTCFKESVEKGLTISDPSLLNRDFSLPPVPDGHDYWTKKLAMEHFNADKISERKLGYILADTEWEYRLTIMAAENELADGKITQRQFNDIEEQARKKWLGD